MPKDAREIEEVIEGVIDEVRLLWNALVQRGNELHVDEPVTMGMRAVLEFLANNGAMTVPNIARARRVTRQHIQGFINELLELGLVRTISNPAHKRSSLIELTASGTRKIDGMRRNEGRLWVDASIDLSNAKLREIGNGLRAIRSAIEA